MNTHAEKTPENKSQSVANTVFQKQKSGESTFQFMDNRPEAVAQRKLQEMANNNPQVSQLRAFQDMVNNSLQSKQTTQLQSIKDNYSSQQQQPIQKKENKTGLPDNLKSGIENLSGYSMDDVKVHYNSDKPTQLQAHAYAQGTDIHLRPAQEKHLSHEAWHAVQQKQGRVKPTLQMKGVVNVNDDNGLEIEADVMGAKALQMKPKENKNRRLGNDSVVQLRAFTTNEMSRFNGVQFILAGGTLANNGLADLLVNKYVHKVSNMADALAYAAKRFAEVAKEADNIKGTMPISGEIDNTNNGAINPFIFQIKIDIEQGRKKRTLGLKYQYSKNSPGYVIQQTLAGENGADLKVLNDIKDYDEDSIATDYSYKHHDTKGIRLSDYLEQASGVDIETNRGVLDARTKLAGEGARFQIVRENVHKIADTSRIYTIDSDGNVEWVTFNVLWQNWAAWFNSQYDITNIKLAEVIHDKAKANAPEVMTDAYVTFRSKPHDIQLPMKPRV